MAQVTLKGNPVHTNGELPRVGSTAPDFELVGQDLSDRTLADFQGQWKVLSINPSLDTGPCAMTARAFNEKVGERPGTVVLVITSDLPFAQKRFCAAEGLDHVVTLSILRDRRFAEDYGVLLTDGPMRGLTARAVVVLDEDNVVRHSELVPEIGNEPNYDAVLRAIG